MENPNQQPADSVPPFAREAANFLARGQALETEGTPASLAEAVKSYDCAIALLKEPSNTIPLARRDLAVAWMNKGNALQKIPTPESLAASVDAYTQAIGHLHSLTPALAKAEEGQPSLSAEIAGHPSTLNTLGAAWMNRGHALHRQGTPESLAEAAQSHRNAVAVLRALPLTPSEQVPAEAALHHRLNLAGALMNLSNVMLGDTEAEHRFAHAREAAVSALNVISADDLPYQHAVAAEVALLSHRAHCDVLGQVLPLVNADTATALTSEGSDSVDAALTLARHCEKHGVKHFRPIAHRLFYFGAQLYRINQPHFLAEFLLEHMDPEKSEGAVADDPVLHGIADEAIAAALQAQQNSPVFDTTTPAAQRQLETNRDLKAAANRLGELRTKYLPPTTA